MCVLELVIGYFGPLYERKERLLYNTYLGSLAIHTRQPIY